MATKTIAGDKVKVEELSGQDVAIFNNDVNTMVSDQQDEFVQNLLNKYQDEVQSVVEAVNDETGTGYGGVVGGGKDLVAQYITPDDFDEFTGTWENTYDSSAGVHTETYISGTLGEEEGFLIFGFRDEQDDPLAYKAKFYSDTDETAAFPLGLELRNEGSNNNQVPSTESRSVMHGLPENEYKIEVKLSESGTDKLEPIGVYVKTANNAWDL